MGYGDHAIYLLLGYASVFCGFACLFGVSGRQIERARRAVQSSRANFTMRHQFQEMENNDAPR